MIESLLTPSQTIGPFFAYGLTPEQYSYAHHTVVGPALATDETPGTPIWITGQIFDGTGEAVEDAMIELRQADAEGRYESDAPGFTGLGRMGTGTDAERRFRLRSVKPGVVQGQAPHIEVIVLMRGLLQHVYTRLYFSDEAEANAQDPVLQQVPAERRPTLIAQRQPGAGTAVYRFDIHMQGEQETVFFDWQ